MEIVSTQQQERRAPALAVRVERLRWLEGALVLVLVLLGAFFFALTIAAKPFPLIDNPDVEDMAQIARHLIDGDSFITSFMPLNGLDYMRQMGRPIIDAASSDRGGWPALTRFPLMPIVFAGVFRVVGETDRALALSSGLFWMAGIALVYLLGKKLFNSYAGILAALLSIGPSNLRQMAPSGLTEPASAFFLLAMLVCIYQARSRRALVLGGVALGLGFLNRSNAALFALPVFGYLFWEGGWRRTLPFLAGAAPFIGAGMLLSYSLAGDPLFNLQFSSAIALRSDAGVLGWYRPEYIWPASFVLQHPDVILGKLLAQGADLVTRQLPQLAFSPYAFALVLIAALRPYPPALHRFRVLVLALFGLHALFISALAAGYGRMYVLFEPVAMVLVAGLVVEWANALAPRYAAAARLAAIALAVGLVSVYGIRMVHRAESLLLPYVPTGEVEVYPSNLEQVQQLVNADVIVASDVPWSVAWRTGRRAIPLPPTPAEMETVEQRFGLEIGAIYVKGVRLGDEPPSWEQWRALKASQGSLPGYTMSQVFPDGSVLYVKQ